MNESDELKECVKELFEQYLNRREESDGGRMFAPIYVSCCRVLMTKPLNELLEKIRILSGAKKVEE
jgi:3'-phosphoadenosine 5'-phosphosulfate sulfotransferase (PAPS reductase)/FAD synthetase